MNEKEKKNKIMTVILWSIFGFIVLPLFFVASVFTIQGNSNKKTVPNAFGYMPMIITSGSMQPDINVGDIVFSKKTDPSNIKKDDVISFWDPENPNKIVTHKVKGTEIKNGELYFNTYGIYTGSDDSPVPADNLVGVYVGKIPLIGNILLVGQSPIGLVLFLLIPLGVVLIFDYMFQTKKLDKKDQEIIELKEEIERLKKQ